jgi:hypothetical protein
MREYDNYQSIWHNTLRFIDFADILRTGSCCLTAVYCSEPQAILSSILPAKAACRFHKVTSTF